MRHLAPTNLGENVTFQVTADRLNRTITVSFQVTDRGRPAAERRDPP
jgi:predicted thioesterase